MSTLTDRRTLRLRETREITLEAPDREALVVDWLNHLLYLFDLDGFLGRQFSGPVFNPEKPEGPGPGRNLRSNPTPGKNRSKGRHLPPPGNQTPKPRMASHGGFGFVKGADRCSFTEAAWGECADTNVKMLALCPGATISEFWDVAGMGTRSTAGFQTAAEVVAVAMHALDSDVTPPSVVSGRKNAFTSKMVRFVPRKMVIKMAGKMFEPAS